MKISDYGFVVICHKGELDMVQPYPIACISCATKQTLLNSLSKGNHQSDIKK